MLIDGRYLTTLHAKRKVKKLQQQDAFYSAATREWWVQVRTHIRYDCCRLPIAYPRAEILQIGAAKQINR